VLLHGSATGSYSWAAVRMGVVQGIDYLESGSEEQLLKEMKRYYSGNVVAAHDLDVF
jgi:hypothetical protein